MAKTSLLKKEKWAKPREAQTPEWWGTGVFKTRLLHIQLGGHGLTVLIDSCKLHDDMLFWAWLLHIQSVVIRYMYVWKIYEPLMMLLNCGVREDSWESLGLQGDPTSTSWRKSVLNIHWRDWCWSWNSQHFGHLMQRTDSLKRPWSPWNITQPLKRIHLNQF